VTDKFRVEVTGLRELQGAFKQLEGNLPKELRVSFKALADHVVGVAQQRMPYISGEAAKSLRPRATQRGASIAFPAGGRPWQGEVGGYYPWLDFGGTTGRGRVAAGGYTNAKGKFVNSHAKATRGGAINRPVIKGGRYLYPAIAASADFLTTGVDHSIESVAKHAGFDTREG
jgi:hypothetical protein